MTRWAALLLTLAVVQARAEPRNYVLPDDTATLVPGPGQDLTVANCAACHSLDIVTTQPRPLPDPRAFWTAEVAKMRDLYGAPIDDADVPKIIDYLAQSYGR